MWITFVKLMANIAPPIANNAKTKNIKFAGVENNCLKPSCKLSSMLHGPSWELSVG
ncbi:hypothetical protein D3C86_2261290 [compost metagenome]